MSEAGSTTSTHAAALSEEDFLGLLEADQVDTGSLAKILSEVHGAGRQVQAASWCELAEETLAASGRQGEAIRLLAMRAAWPESRLSLAEECRKRVTTLFETARPLQVYVDQAGFQKSLPGIECLRRLQLLMDLRPGVLCQDRTWGFGVVRQVDTFYKRVEIDFEKKPEHQLTFEYAAETLELLDEQHLLAVRHREPERVREMIANQPGEIVRMCLRSYGPLPVTALQDRLVPGFVPESDWKRFWEAARKQLKQDPMVEIPARRTDPIRLLARERAYDDEWFERLLAERNLDRLIESMETMVDEGGHQQLNPAQRSAIHNRLEFLLVGARHEGEIARCALLAGHLGLLEELKQIDGRLRQLLSPEGLKQTARKLPARLLRPFLDFLQSRYGDLLIDLLLSEIPSFEIGLLTEAVSLLLACGRQQECATILRRQIADQKPSIEVICWLLRNTEKLEEWSLGSLPELIMLAITQLGEDYSGERLKARNQVRDRFIQKEWLLSMLAKLTDRQRREFMDRVRECPAFPTMDKRSVLGHAIKAYPVLQETTRHLAEPEEKPRARFTSVRSYRARQAQLEKLVKYEIPANSKEIALARSYGDLRENHEYKAAKEMQGILLRRQGELEQMLTQVKPSEFRDFASDQAGLAAGVVLEYKDGRRETYYILGEWDRDEKLGIISSTTRMAEALSGHRKGDAVTVPTEHGEEGCTIVDVHGLPDEIRAWIQEEHATIADDI